MSISRILGITAVALAVVFFIANYAVGRIIQERLPQALSEEGYPVSISNVSASLWRLRAYADELVYGPADRPLLVFHDLYVELDLSQLLSGVISLNSAGSRLVDLYTSRFQEGADPESDTDFSGTERWLPNSYHVDEVLFWENDEVIHEVTDFNFLVTSANGRQADWLDPRGGRTLRFVLQTDNQYEILAAEAAEVAFSISHLEEGEPFVTGRFSSRPGEAGFDAELTARARSFQGSLTYQTDTLFSLPERSKLLMEKLDSDELAEIAPLFEANPDDDLDPVRDRQTLLRAPLPLLELPEHYLQLEVVEMLGPDDEQVRNVKADLQLRASEDGPGTEMVVSSFNAELPRADLSGSLKLHFGEIWDGNFDIKIETLSRSPERLRQFATTEWLWESGEASADFRGRTLAELVESAQGEADLEGVYRGRTEVPIGIQAKISDRRGRIGADLITLSLGQSTLTGKVWLQEPREKLYVRLHTESFLATEFIGPSTAEAQDYAAGWLIPEVTWWDSSLQVDARLTADKVILPGGELTALDMNIQRQLTGSVIHASFTTENVGTLHAQAHTSRDGHHRSIDVNIQADDIAAEVFADIDAKASGQFRLQGEGSTLSELLNRVNTRIAASLRFDQTQGEMALRGNPALRMDENRVVGLNFENIRVNITNEGLISGRLVYDIREPAIRGEVHSEGFDLDELMAILPASDAVVAPEFGSVLRMLPNLDLQLEADFLAGFDQELQQFSVHFVNEPNKVVLENLHFESRFGQLKAQAQLLDIQNTAKFELSGTLGDLVVSSVTNQQSMQRIDEPMSGTIEISTSGDDWQALTGNLRGHIRLQTPEQTPQESRVNVDLEVNQQGAGISANLKELTYGASTISGQASFLPGDIPKLTVTAESAHLDLIALDALFEDPETAEGDADQSEGGLSLAAQADEVFESVRSILGSPFQFFTGDADADSDQFFDDEPVDLSVVRNLDGDFNMVLHDINSDEGVFDQVTLTGTTKSGMLTAKISATQNLGGELTSTLQADSNIEPYPVSLSTDIRNFRTGPDPALAPTSIFAEITAAGNSQAALAATSSGEIYVETGEGEADFANFALGFFTEDLLSRVAGVLLPEDDDETPELNCSIAFGQIKDGVLTTPKGVMIQSRTANILIRSEVDMKEERLTAQFDTRSRTGAGVSMGNVFSNTVRIRGSLNDPALVPNATGIIWRSWAALATGGLSLLGESFVKRMLSSDQACDRVREDIQELVCGGTTPAASSPLVCPAVAVTS